MTGADGNRHPARSPRNPDGAAGTEVGFEDIEFVMREFILDYTLASLPFEH